MYSPYEWVFAYSGTTPTISPRGPSNERCCGIHPVRLVVEALSSSAFKKAWETVGLTSPAQASQVAAGISAIAAWTRTVTVAPVSSIGGRAPRFPRHGPLLLSIAIARLDGE